MAKLIRELKQLHKNALNIKERKNQQIQYMKDNGLDKYWIDGDFDLGALLNSDSIFKVGARGPQKVAMPFSDKMFAKFRQLPKKRIGNPIMHNNGNKLIHGTYLIGDDQGKPVIYAFSISRDPNEKYSYKNFNIKLDMLVAGKEWLPLIRVDGLGSPHPNYIVKGRVVASEEFVRKTSCSHIHLNNSATQVLTSDLSYTTAMNLPASITRHLKNNDQKFFKSALDYTLSLCGMSKELLSSENPNYVIDFNHYLFDYQE